jgi:hypothetical protein
MEVYLKTPNLPRNDIVKALLARGKARKSGGESLIAKAEQGALDPVTTDPELSWQFRLSRGAKAGSVKSGTPTAVTAREGGGCLYNLMSGSGN